VGVAERSERLTLVLIVAGLTGLGVPFVLAIGLWVLAVASTVTFVQRVLVVRKAVGPRAAARDPGDSGARKDKA
jgi:CDP-diacylglycerol--glycerol-3-phosphate 3-phosphatidyltransferase